MEIQKNLNKSDSHYKVGVISVPDFGLTFQLLDYT